MAVTSLSSRKLKALKPLNLADVRKLAQLGREIHYSRGCYVFRENDKGDSFYVLLEGLIQVLKTIRGKGQVSLRTLKPGNLFGEMSLFTGKRRTADCHEECRRAGGSP
jgi:CRP-like cAMP-binding protein